MFFTAQDGYYELSKAGAILIIVIILALLILTAFIHGKRNEGKPSLFSTKQLAFCGVSLGLAYVASYIRIIHMPWGGSVTLCSMLFVVLIGYWYGPQIGLISAFAYSLLQFVQGGGTYILSPLQVCFDYLFAFTALGLAGFFKDKANGLLTGYLVSILVRGLFQSIAGYLYWMDYMPDNFPKSLALIYPLCYNYAYILAEGVLTVIIINIPTVKKGLARLKTMAVS